MLKLGIDPEKLYRATFIRQYGLCCCNMALVSFQLFCKNLGHLREFFWANGLPPPLAKNFPYAYVWLVIMTGCFNIFVVPYDHFFCKWLGIVLYILNLRPVEEW